MKYFLIIISFFSLNLFSQIDSLDIDSVIVIDTVMHQNVLFIDYFSSKYLETLPVSYKIVESKLADHFKQYFFLFFLNLLCIATLLLNFSKFKVKKVLGTMFNINLLKQLAQSESKKENAYLYAFFILFFICLLALCFTLNKLFDLNIDLLTIATGMLAFFAFDLIVNYLTMYIFKENEVFDSVYYNNISIMLLTIPIIIISILLWVYLPINIAFYISFIGLTILILIYFWKEIRNILILESFKIKIVSFYFFLYLCTFKILPIAILLKYFSSKL